MRRAGAATGQPPFCCCGRVTGSGIGRPRKCQKRQPCGRPIGPNPSRRLPGELPFASTAVCLLELIGRALRRVTLDGVISVPDSLAHDTDVGGGLDAWAYLTRPGCQNLDRYVQFGEEDAFVRSAGQNKHLRSPFRQLLWRDSQARSGKTMESKGVNRPPSGGALQCREPLAAIPSQATCTW
jgi:hypothetical protein